MIHDNDRERAGQQNIFGESALSNQLSAKGSDSSPFQNETEETPVSLRSPFQNDTGVW